MRQAELTAWVVADVASFLMLLWAFRRASTGPKMPRP